MSKQYKKKWGLEIGEWAAIIIGLLFLFFFMFGHYIPLPIPGQSTPPFYVEAGLSGITGEEPIEAGKTFGIDVSFEPNDYYFDDIKLSFTIPPEVEVKQYPEKILKRIPADEIILMRTLKWNGNMKPWQKKDLDIRFISKTDWTKWSHPIKIDISLDAREKSKKQIWPDGHYKRTISFSNTAFSGTDWYGPGKMYGR